MILSTSLKTPSRIYWYGIPTGRPSGLRAEEPGTLEPPRAQRAWYPCRTPGPSAQKSWLRPGSRPSTAGGGSRAPSPVVIFGEAHRVVGAAAEPPSLSRPATSSDSAPSAGARELILSTSLNAGRVGDTPPAPWWKSTRTSSSGRRSRLRDRAVGAPSGWDAARAERVSRGGRVIYVHGISGARRISGPGKGLI